MTAAAVVTVAGAGLLVLVLAGYLALLARIMSRANRALDDVLDGVRAAASRAEPIEDALTEINDDVTTIAHTLRGAPGFAARRGRE